MTKQDLGVQLKLGMRKLASGVCVITTLSAEKARVAMTATSVTSVSDNPPSLLVCVNREARLDPVLSESGVFAVNVLSNAHQAISDNCAKPSEGESRFGMGAWDRDGRSGLSYLSDALTVFFCETQHVVPYGTHNIYIGNISHMRLSDTPAGLLIYADGAYHTL